MPECNPNLTPNVTHQPSLLGGAENMKLLFDDVMSHMSRTRGVSASHDNAWETLRFRIAQDAASLSHFVNMGTALAGQIGVTEGQQSVSPIKLAAADTQNQQPAGAVYPPIRNVDQGGATATNVVQTALSEVSAQVAALSNVVTKLAEALVPIITKAAGNASAPSPAA